MTVKFSKVEGNKKEQNSNLIRLNSRVTPTSPVYSCEQFKFLRLLNLLIVYSLMDSNW
jgi:hypothetical protein